MVVMIVVEGVVVGVWLFICFCWEWLDVLFVLNDLFVFGLLQFLVFGGCVFVFDEIVLIGFDDILFVLVVVVLLLFICQFSWMIGWIVLWIVFEEVVDLESIFWQIVFFLELIVWCFIIG